MVEVEREVDGLPVKAVEATVIELLPNATCRLRLADRAEVIGHAVGPLAANFVRIRPKDRVLIELSPHDGSRGRIVKLLNKE